MIVCVCYYVMFEYNDFLYLYILKYYLNKYNL